MQSKNPFLNDFSKLVTSAFGVAQSAKSEMETLINSKIERWLSERDFVNRDEFDAVRLMAQKNTQRNVELQDIIANLEARLDAMDQKLLKNVKPKK